MFFRAWISFRSESRCFLFDVYMHTYISTSICSMSFILVMCQPCFDRQRSLSFYFYVQYLMVPFLIAVRQEIVVSVSLPNVFFLFEPKKIRYSFGQWFVFAERQEKQRIAWLRGPVRGKETWRHESPCYSRLSPSGCETIYYSSSWIFNGFPGSSNLMSDSPFSLWWRVDSND